ncbi:hypothetical protein B0T19DRAFT_435351 [Cercophora scortea]|uniref:Uncharacterized protein n=1 Tax=Cercophora scortea TaxID=314031 RepID=A0AAE0I3L6_9PEZI|nr:hypothetical protein B0T19DRAFT_435351 [Cercophora scortea]
MGSAMSRCAPRSTHVAPFSDIHRSQFLDRQPNWLVTPSSWRSRSSTSHSARYRTPTPYPKGDRQPLRDEINISEKTAAVVDAQKPDIRHVEVVTAAAAEPPRSKQHIQIQATRPQIQRQPSVITITWEPHSRLNRFERIS